MDQDQFKTHFRSYRVSVSSQPDLVAEIFWSNFLLLQIRSQRTSPRLPALSSRSPARISSLSGPPSESFIPDSQAEPDLHSCSSVPLRLRSRLYWRSIPVLKELELCSPNRRKVHGLLHPVVYGSHSLTTAERNYPITELETQVDVWAVTHFIAYLYGHDATIYTHHTAVGDIQQL